MRLSLRSSRSAAPAAGALLALLASCAGLPGAIPGGEAHPAGTAEEAAPPTAPAVLAPVSEGDALAAYYGGDLEAAEAAYREVLARAPEDDGARVNLAQVLREAGRPLEALEELEILLAASDGRPGGGEAGGGEAGDGDTGGRGPRSRELGEPALAPESLRLAAAETALFAGLPQRALGYIEASPAAAAAAAGLHLAGLALKDLGRGAEAAEALAASLEKERFNPLGWLQLGGLHLELGAAEQAEAELLEALAQDRNLTQALLPLAQIYLADGRIDKAYGLLRRAEAALPGSRKVPALLAELLAEHPELTAKSLEEKRVRREAAEPRKAESFPRDLASIPTVRVGLAEKVKELHLKTGGPFRAESASGGRRADVDAGMVIMVRLGEGATLEALDGGGRPLIRYEGAVRLSCRNPADTTILFDVSFGEGSFWAGSEDRMYRGVIELVPHPDGITVVNQLSVEEYLYSVLPSEMPSSWPAAALEAQAVAARSYTLANLGRFAARGFDLMGSVVSAAYRGMGSENPTVRAAVDATRGLVLLAPGVSPEQAGGESGQGKPLSAFYSANSGGHTETTEYVWGFPSAFRAVPDGLLLPRPERLSPAGLARWLAERPVTFSSHPQYANRSAYRWRLWVHREEIEARLGLGESLGSVLTIAAVRRGTSGRIPEVRIRGTAGETTVKWDAVRWKLGGLRSSLFVVEPKLGADGLQEYFVFTGAGWGHGVGMCQTGAAGMASVGFSAEAILRHYYGSAELEALY